MVRFRSRPTCSPGDLASILRSFNESHRRKSGNSLVYDVLVATCLYMATFLRKANAEKRLIVEVTVWLASAALFLAAICK